MVSRAAFTIVAYLGGWVAAHQMHPPTPSMATLHPDAYATTESADDAGTHTVEQSVETMFDLPAQMPAEPSDQASGTLRIRQAEQLPPIARTAEREGLAPDTRTAQVPAEQTEQAIQQPASEATTQLIAPQNQGLIDPEYATDAAPPRQQPPAIAPEEPVPTTQTVETAPPATAPPATAPPATAPPVAATPPLATVMVTPPTTAEPPTASVVTPVVEPTKPTPTALPKLRPDLAQLKRKIQIVLDIYRRRVPNTREHCPWTIMHSLIAYGTDRQIAIGGPRGQRANAIGWICYNYPCRDIKLFYLENDLIRGRRGPGKQGHEGQFLSMLAQSRVNIDYPMKVDGRDLRVRDLVRTEMVTCRPRSELSFKLIGLAYYLDIDDTWTSNDGGKWNLEKMVVEELRQPVNGAACGGTHRLDGLTFAVHKCRQGGRPLTGAYQQADTFLRNYHNYTFRLQNRDGSFSTEWFVGRGFDPDPKKRLVTSGHIGEWLCLSLPDEQLHRPEMLRAMHYLSNLLLRGQNQKLDVGPLGHALHALNLYDQRALQTKSDAIATRPR